jgi:hypothetical protein
LVSTIGLRSTSKKISRKAIQEVNVKKACETILQPAAPIALRLQGSLLYGLSRVYSQQCQYVLTDAERVQAHMRAFYRALGGSDNALDPQAGRSKYVLKSSLSCLRVANQTNLGAMSSSLKTTQDLISTMTFLHSSLTTTAILLCRRAVNPRAKPPRSSRHTKEKTLSPVPSAP